MSENEKKAIKKMVEKEYKKLGSFTWHEGVILGTFSTLVVTWVMRRPQFIPGWDYYMKYLFDDQT